MRIYHGGFSTASVFDFKLSNILSAFILYWSRPGFVICLCRSIIVVLWFSSCDLGLVIMYTSLQNLIVCKSAVFVAVSA